MRHFNTSKLAGYFVGISLILMALFKVVFGIYSQANFKNGFVVIVAGAYSFLIALTRIIYARNIDSDERKQLYVYRNFAFILIPVAILFFISNMITLNDNVVDYGLAFDIIITFVFLSLFIFSLKGIFKLGSQNVLTRSVKLVSFTGSLINLVFIEHIFEYQLQNLLGVSVYSDFKFWFTIVIVCIILFLSLIMLIASIIHVHNYKKERGMI